MVGSSANANNEQRFSKTSAQNNRMVGVVIKSPGTKSEIFSTESLSPLGYGSDHRTSKRPRTLQRFFRRCAATLSPSSLPHSARHAIQIVGDRNFAYIQARWR